MKRVIALILSLVMLLSLVPTTAWAEEMEQAQDDGASYEFAAAYVAEEDLGVSNEALHAAYIQRVLDESVGLETPMPFRTSALKAGTLEKEIYDALKVELAKIAAGTRTSTEITISGLTGSWSAEDLGVEAIFDDTGFTEDARIAIFGDSTGNEKGILGVVYDCLLADCPLELYWHDKTDGVAFGARGIMDNGAGGVEFGSVTFKFYVATDYSVDKAVKTFTTDSAKTKAAANAVETAQSIVDSYASKSNYDKLDAYRKIICDLVSYNNSAASGNSTTMGINPWQIIYVFDQDNTTNVVCEGYAKAFQYLCDLSTFLGDVECHTVSGEMDGVNHMWNVVTMEDGKNYLVDVTNCDSGTIGASDKLFMATTANTADSHQTHTFAIGSQNVVFTYGEDMADLFCDGYLALAVAPYGTEKQPASVNIAGSNRGQAGETVGVVLRLSGTALMGLEAKLTYSDMLEFISCTAVNNNWDIEYNEADGTLVANTATAPIFRDTELVSLKFRVKDTAAVGSNWNVTFSDITVSDGDADNDSLEPVSWTGKVIAAPVAKWGTVEEKFGEGTLQEALDAAESAEGYLFIDLLRDVTAAEPLTLSAGGAIIDLCGYEIHGSFIVDGGALTVYNGAITAEGNVLTATEDATAIVVGDSIVVTSTDGCGIYCDAEAVIEIHGEIISRSKSDETAAVYFNGSNLGMFGGFIEGEVCGLLVDGGNVIIADSQFIDESAPLGYSAIRGETCGLVVNGGSVTVAKKTEIRAAARGEAIGALVLGGELTVTNSFVRGAIGAALQGGTLTVDEESYIEGNTICGISVEEGTLNIADAAAVYGMAVGVLVQKGALTVENGAIAGGEIGLMLNGEETTATVSGAVYGYTDTAIFANGGTLTLGDIQLSGSVNYDDNGTFIGGGELYVGSDAKVYANEMFAPASDMVFRVYGADVASQQVIAPLEGAALNAENFAYAGMGKVITKGDDGALYLGACDHGGSIYFADEYNNPIDTIVLDYSDLENYLYDIKLVGLDEGGTENDRRLGIRFWGDGASIFDPVDTESKESFYEVFGREVGKYGTILFDKPGTSTLQMFDVDTDAAVAELTIVAYYIDTAKKFTTKVDVPAYGLEVGMETRMEVFGTDAETPLPAGKFTFTSSNESVATVGEHDGMIQAVGVGSATITATANEDPLKRKVTYKLTVVAPQAEYVTITPDTNEGEWKYRADSGAEYDNLDSLLSLDETFAGPVLKLDAGTLADSFTFDFAYATSLEGVAVKVVSNNTKVAAVKDNKDGTVTVTIPTNADGAATITVTAQDKRGAQANLFVQVRNYTPRFDTKKMTYNPALAGSSLDVPLVESYGASIDRDSIECIAVPKKGDVVTFENVEYDGSKLMIPVDESKLVDGAYTVTISGKYGEDKTSFSYSFALTVKTAMPKVTVKQDRKIDMFNDGSFATFVTTAKNEIITSVDMEDTDGVFFRITDLSAHGVVFGYDAEKAATCSDKKVTVLVSVAGYEKPVAVSASVGTETKKPSLKLSASSVTVNTAMVEEGDAPTFSFVVTSKDGKVMRPMTELQESNITVNGDIAYVDSVSDGMVVMKLLDEKGGKVSFDVQLNGWTQSVPLSITVKTSDKLPKVKLSSATLKLNNQFYQQEAATELVFDQSLGYNLDVEKTLDTIFSDSFVHEYGDIVFTMEGNVLKAKFWQNENSYAFVDKGSYNYQITPVLDDGTATGYALAPISFKVAVENTMPKAKFSTSAIKLNSSNLTAKREVATTVVTLPASYRLDGVLFKVDGYQTVVTTNEWTVIKGTNGVVKARLSDAIANGIAFSMATSATTEKFDLKCIPLASTADALEGEMVALAEAKLTVQIARDHKMSAAVSGKGKLDAVNRAGSYIEYTMTKLTGVQGQVSDVSLIGRDAALFTLSEMTYNAKGQPVARLQLREDAPNLSSKAQYEVALRYTLLGADGAQMWVESPVQKVKLSQTALKVTVAGNNAVVYQSQSNGMVEFTFISATAGVKIGNVTVGSKNDAVAKALLTDCQVENLDGMVTVRIPIANAERLTAGKSINCTFDVTAVGHLSDAKVTSVKATFKMAK